MRDVKGKVAVITGAAGGIGLGAARAFAQQGMRLVLADIDEPRLVTSVVNLRDEGADVIGIHTDVREKSSLEALREATLTHFGAVHLVCNNAGGPIPRKISDLSDTDWRLALDLNLFSVVYGVLVFLPVFEAQNHGHLNATASMSGLVPFPPVVTYNVAKAGVIAFMETLAHELRQKASPIEVSVFCPGEVATYGIEHALGVAQATGYQPSQEELNIAEAAQAGILENGLDPDSAGQILCDGILQGQFWIFSHPDWVNGHLINRHVTMIREGKLVEF